MDNMDQMFKLVNLVQAAIIVLTGFVDLSSTFDIVLQGIVLLAIGGTLGALEVTDVITPTCQRYASFLFSFIGRGVFSIVLMPLVISHRVLPFLAGTYLMLLGAGYIALAFVPSIDPPANMRNDEIDGFSDGEIEGIV